MTDKPAIIVYRRHVRAIFGCSFGSRRWCKRHGFDFHKLLYDGIDSRELRATGDPLAIAVCDYAEAEAEQ